jgi:hypothetical protein
MDSHRRQLLSILSLDFTNLVSISLLILSAVVPEFELIRMFAIFIMLFGQKLMVQDGPFSMLQEVSPFHIINIRNTLRKRNLIWTLIFAISVFAFVFEAYVVMSPLDIEIFRKISAITMLVIAVFVAALIYIVALKLIRN